MFESYGRFIIVLLDLNATITLYICVLFIIYTYIYTGKFIVLHHFQARYSGNNIHFQIYLYAYLQDAILICTQCGFLLKYDF